ncbi:CIA30 family protein [Candidatus Marinimicrobia bacterium]|nr:CIA30 family protein [Candidatus Neomarinimicrobiota bacterium]
MKKSIILVSLAISINTLVYAQNITILNPSENIGINNWKIINDGVMGGISQSSIYINKENNIIFNGFVSLENNGGFCSCRISLNDNKLKDIESFVLRVKGDGKIYKFRLRMDGSYLKNIEYSSDFQTKKDEWIDVIIPVKNFKPYLYGFRSRISPKLRTQRINSMGFLIADKQEGNFNLEIMYVKTI